MEEVIDGRRFKIWRWPHWAIVHWALNPGLAFNELILGQRIPKETFIEQGVDRPLTERQYAFCRDCGALTNFRLWVAAKTLFRNYFGLVCPSCGAKIPLEKNVFTRVVLVVATPITWPLRRIFETKALERQRAKLLRAKAEFAALEPEVRRRQSPLRMGVIFGLFMGVYSGVQAAFAGASVAVAVGIAAAGAIVTGVFFGGACGFSLRGGVDRDAVPFAARSR